MLLVGCSSSAETGSCEFQYDEASKDGVIQPGLKTCTPNWAADKCNEHGVATDGLKVSGFKFTKGGTCTDQTHGLGAQSTPGAR
jgi:hypothetical protein